VPLSGDVPEREQRIRRGRVSMGMGMYCSWQCLTSAMPRLGKLNDELNERQIGLRRLREGEALPEMPHT
jgi:hypothetical protein